MYTKMDGTSWCLIDEGQLSHKGKVAIIYPDGSLWLFGTRSYNTLEMRKSLQDFIAGGYPEPKYKVSFYLHTERLKTITVAERAEKLRHYFSGQGYEDVTVELEYTE